MNMERYALGAKSGVTVVGDQPNDNSELNPIKGRYRRTIPDSRGLLQKIFFLMARIFGPLVIIACDFTISSYVVFFCGLRLLRSASLMRYAIGIVCIAYMSIIFLMVIFSLALVTIGDTGSTESALNTERIVKQVGIETIESLQRCPKCGLPKPPRAHHCSSCGRCNLKMDHHCPAVGTCITIRNLQPFVVMLNWACEGCLFGFSATAIRAFLTFEFTRQTFLDICVSFGCICIYFAISYLRNDTLNGIRRNITTLESIYALPHVYDLGEEKNIEQIFGTGRFAHFWPKKSSMTGFEWCYTEMSNANWQN